MSKPAKSNHDNSKPGQSRREFMLNLGEKFPGWLLLLSTLNPASLLADMEENYDPTQHNYAMGVDIHKCIGCGRCADACKRE